MRPPGGILAPGESLIATGNASIYLSPYFLCLASHPYFFLSCFGSFFTRFRLAECYND